MGLALGSRLGSYRILSVVGAGGMGEVYRARDERLDRDVAIKVLPESVSKDPKALARFDREAKAVAALSHPNILTLHDLRTEGGVAYAVMELLEGETLRRRLLAGPIPPREAVEYALQIARGLAAAHERGIVHRDIKPENIFLSKGGHLKILDFGIARQKDASPAGFPTSAPTVTADTDAGTVLGTVGYMSPEQAVGDELDFRSDIFSLGVVLYEMLSGSKPFSRSTAGATIAAILKEDPPDLSESDRHITPLLDHVVRHCLEKDRTRRFQSAQDIAFALSEASGPAVLPARSFRTHDARRNQLVAAGLIVALAVAGYVFLRRADRTADEGVRRVAVLPFENLGSSDDDYFVDGMSDAVRGKLTSLPGIEVIARGSSVGYKKTSKTPNQIADELGAPYLLMATVRWQKSGDKSRVQISPELVLIKKTGAPASRWQQPFDAALTDVFEVQADVATRVAQALGVALGAAEEKDISQRPTRNLAAYDAYLKGVENEKRMYWKEARLAYAKALELDPTFAMAMLALARNATDDDQRTALLKRAAKEKDRLTELERLHVDIAVAFDEKRYDDALKIAAETHQKFPSDTRSAQMLAHQELSKGNTDQAIKIFEELLTIEPNNAEAYNQVGYFYGYRGDYDKAVDAFKRYQLFDPDTANPFDSLGEVQAYSGRYNEALENLNRALAIKPDFVDSVKNIAVVHEGRGEYREAIEQYERAAEMTDDPKRQRDYINRAARAAHYLDDKAEMRRLFGKIRAVKTDGKYAEIENAFLDASLTLVDGRGTDAEKTVRAVLPKLDALLAEEKLPRDWKPHFPLVNFLLALSLETQGKADAALEYWKKNANPPRPFDNFEDRRAIYEARAKVAVALARKGDLAGADKLLAQNRKWNPSWAPTKPDELEVERLRRQKAQTAAR